MSSKPQHLLELAAALARVKHAGQKRKQTGEDYFNHVERVADRALLAAAGLGLDATKAATIGLIHDLIEDTHLAPLELRHVGFPWDVVDDVVALSRRKDETYTEFIDRGVKDLTDEGLLVKWADLQDNLNEPPGKLRARYIAADIQLRAALKKRGHDLSRLA